MKKRTPSKPIDLSKEICGNFWFRVTGRNGNVRDVHAGYLLSRVEAQREIVLKQHADKFAKGELEMTPIYNGDEVYVKN